MLNRYYIKTLPSFVRRAALCCRLKLEVVNGMLRSDAASASVGCEVRQCAPLLVHRLGTSYHRCEPWIALMVAVGS
jgi:hypothetical protein